MSAHWAHPLPVSSPSPSLIVVSIVAHVVDVVAIVAVAVAVVASVCYLSKRTNPRHCTLSSHALR